MELNFVLIGPPGAGKGTQAENLRNTFQVPYLATGDIFRAHVKNQTELGKRVTALVDAGQLVTDELVLEVVGHQLDQDDMRQGFILDGFPRTIPQAEALARRLAGEGRSLTAAILIDVTDETVVDRVSGRRHCVDAGHLYHVSFRPPERPDVCDRDGSRLIQRDDDRPKAIRRRLEEYHTSTEPLLGLYARQGILRRIDGSRSPTAVWEQIQAAVAQLRAGGADGPHAPLTGVPVADTAGRKPAF